MAKAQFQSTEALRVRYNPFINSVTGAYIIGTDTCTLFWEAPDGTNGNVAMTWDAIIQMWHYDFAVGSYVQGEWRFRAVSDDASALPQWKTYVWGDYVNDITAAATSAAAADAKAAIIRKIQTNHWKVDTAANKFYVYDDDKVTVLYEFTVRDETGVLNAFRIFERTPV